MSVGLAFRAMTTSARYYARRIWSKPPFDLGLFASRSLKVCDGKRLPAVRPFFWQEHASRIRDGAWYSASRLCEELTTQRQAELRPLFVRELRDAYLIDGSIYLGSRLRVELRSEDARGNLLRRMSILPIRPRLECSEATLVSGIAGSTWFGHWLVDELPLQMLASDLGLPISHLRPDHRDEPFYRQVLNLKPPERVGTARVSRLRIIDEFAQNASKIRRYWKIRDHFQQGRREGHRVFISRGHWGTPRAMQNEVELQERFRTEGFSVFEMATSSFSDLLNVLNGASVVVSVEGSHLTHALFMMADYASMIILNPPERTLTVLADLAPYFGLSAAMFICASGPDGSFSADEHELFRFIDAAIVDHRARRSEVDHFLDSVRKVPILEPVWQ
jgi:hypothetical protein